MEEGIKGISPGMYLVISVFDLLVSFVLLDDGGAGIGGWKTGSGEFAGDVYLVISVFDLLVSFVLLDEGGEGIGGWKRGSGGFRRGCATAQPGSRPVFCRYTRISRGQHESNCCRSPLTGCTKLS